jgi:hypothetical protein
MSARPHRRRPWWIALAVADPRTGRPVPTIPLTGLRPPTSLPLHRTPPRRTSRETCGPVGRPRLSPYTPQGFSQPDPKIGVVRELSTKA